ncbi:MAG: ribonuclease HII [Bacilli bacterium]
MLVKEREFYSPSVKLIVGLDEAGRGPLAGPLYCAAVVFDPSYQNEGINDSKKLSPKRREALYDVIIQNALSYAIVSASVEEIDKDNILEADKRIMEKALTLIKAPYDFILTDDVPLRHANKPLVAMIKGDAQCLNVAAASILAKVSRDRYMDELDKKYPDYGFKKHKGYGTALHLEMLRKYGPIEGVHRKTFRPISDYYSKQETLF